LKAATHTLSLFVLLIYYAESTVHWFVVREKYCWMAADSADKFKRIGRLSISVRSSLLTHSRSHRLQRHNLKIRNLVATAVGERGHGGKKT
jgi:hypothetical protein